MDAELRADTVPAGQAVHTDSEFAFSARLYLPEGQPVHTPEPEILYVPGAQPAHDVEPGVLNLPSEQVRHEFKPGDALYFPPGQGVQVLLPVASL